MKIPQTETAGSGWLTRLASCYRSRQVSKLKEKIARLTAEVEYWRGKTTVTGTQPEWLCFDIGEKTGKIAALRARLEHLQNEENQAKA